MNGEDYLVSSIRSNPPFGKNKTSTSFCWLEVLTSSKMKLLNARIIIFLFFFQIYIYIYKTGWIIFLKKFSCSIPQGYIIQYQINRFYFSIIFSFVLRYFKTNTIYSRRWFIVQKIKSKSSDHEWIFCNLNNWMRE